MNIIICQYKDKSILVDNMNMDKRVVIKQIGKNIQKIRKERKITQENLAELINIETISMSKIETGKSYPTSENLSKIANILNVEPYELFIFENTKNTEELKQEIIHLVKNIEDDRKKLIKILNTIKSL